MEYSVQKEPDVSIVGGTLVDQRKLRLEVEKASTFRLIDSLTKKFATFFRENVVLKRFLPKKWVVATLDP